MTLEQINALTTEDVEQILLERLGMTEEEATLADIDDEFELYKSELIAAENARLAEIARQEDLARIADIKARWNAIPDIRLALAGAGNNAPNPPIELQRIIDENDQAMLEAIESVDVMQDLRSAKLDDLRGKRDQLLLEADHTINKLEDASQDASAHRAYRQALRDVTEQFKDESGKYTADVDSLNIGTFVFPSKPE